MQTLMSAEMGLINADTIRSVRIQEAATTAPVHEATDLKEWDGLVSVCAPPIKSNPVFYDFHLQ